MEHETLKWTEIELPGYMYALTYDGELGFSVGSEGWEVWSLATANRLDHGVASGITAAMEAAQQWLRDNEEANNGR